jgi:hypothetical protein
MAKIQSTVVQNFILKFEQMGVSGVDKAVQNLSQSVAEYQKAVQSGQGKGVGMGKQAAAYAEELNKDMQEIAKKHQEVLQNPSKEGYAEILEMASDLEKKLIAGVKHAFSMGRVFQDGGKDVKKLNEDLKKTSDLMAANTAKLQQLKKQERALIPERDTLIDKEALSMGLSPTKMKSRTSAQREVERLEEAQKKSNNPQEKANIASEIESVKKILAIYDQYDQKIKGIKGEIKQVNDELKLQQKTYDQIHASLTADSP